MRKRGEGVGWAGGVGEGRAHRCGYPEPPWRGIVAGGGGAAADPSDVTSGSRRRQLGGRTTVMAAVAGGREGDRGEREGGTGEEVSGREAVSWADKGRPDTVTGHGGRQPTDTVPHAPLWNEITIHSQPLTRRRCFRRPPRRCPPRGGNASPGGALPRDASSAVRTQRNKKAETTNFARHAQSPSHATTSHRFIQATLPSPRQPHAPSATPPPFSTLPAPTPRPSPSPPLSLPTRARATRRGPRPRRGASATRRGTRHTQTRAQTAHRRSSRAPRRARRCP